MAIFEILMMLCFGFAWPTNIVNSVKSKSTKGKNLLFLILIVLAYIFGILNKLLFSRDVALFFYIINLIMVLIDVVLFFVNRRHEIEKGLISNYYGLL